MPEFHYQAAITAIGMARPYVIRSLTPQNGVRVEPAEAWRRARLLFDNKEQLVTGVFETESIEREVTETGIVRPLTVETAPAFPECKNYEELRDNLRNLPVTWYPDLLRNLVLAAYAKDVFKPNGASTLIKNTEKRELGGGTCSG